MKIIDGSPFRGNDGSLSLSNRLRGIWKYGQSWDKDRQAQENLIAQLRNLVDNQYTLLRDVTHSGVDHPIPLILVGPTGVYMIYASAAKGIYRAKNETWAEMDSLHQRFKPTHPNLIARALLQTRFIQAYLAKHEQRLTKVEPVIFFSQSGIHIEATRPAVRLVMMDGLDRFITGIVQGQPSLTFQEIDCIVTLFTDPRAERGEAISDKTPAKTANNLIGVGNIRMHPWQWVVIGGMALIQACFVVAFVTLAF